MKKNQFATILMLMVFFSTHVCNLYGEEVVNLQYIGNHDDRIEFYPIADMPDAVYYDSEAGEIIIVADGTSLYYNVEIVSDNLNLTVISTQVSGYGDVIDISSLSSGSYTIVITSQFLNEYEGQFTII